MLLRAIQLELYAMPKNSQSSFINKLMEFEQNFSEPKCSSVRYNIKGGSPSLPFIMREGSVSK